MRLNGSIELYRYWNRLRDGRPAPDRREIEPADIKTLLADTFILERDWRGQAVFRLAGTRICSTFGRELKGFSFASLWCARDVGTMMQLANEVFAAQIAASIEFTGESEGKRMQEFEAILLPLTGGRESPRALGTIQTEARPFWLGADPIEICRAIGFRAIDPERDDILPAGRANMQVPPLSPRALPLEKAPGSRRFHHLVVLEGGKRK